MIRIVLLIGLILAFLPAVPVAQMITGTVKTDSGEPLADAHVRLKHSIHASTTDTLGRFELHLSGYDGKSAVLIVSRIGFTPMEVDLEKGSTGWSPVRITLKEKVYRSDAVVITATRTPRDIEEVGIPVTVVNGEEIQQMGSMRLNEVLREQTGMQLVNDHGMGIQIQGFDPDYTLIMIDGNPVIGRTAGTLDLTRISVRNVEQIEIVKGPSSALWGSDALAGVVNIITRQGSEELSGGFTSRYGKHNTVDLNGDISVNYGELRNRVFINRNSSGGYRLNPSSVSQTVPEFQNHTLGYRGSLTLSDQIELSGDLRWFHETQQNRSAILLQGGQIRLLNSDAGLTDMMGAAGIRYSPVSRLEMNLKWFSSYYSTESELVFTENRELFDATEFNQYYNKPEFQAGYRWDSLHHSMIGAGAIFERLEADRYPSQPNFTTQFFFTQHSWTPSVNIELTGGLRYDQHSEYSSQLSPKLSARYRATDRIQFRISAGRGFKAPDFRQLFLDFTNASGGYSVFGSSTVADGIRRELEEGTIDRILIPVESLDEIRAESSWAVNVGLDLDATDNLRLRLNLFRNNVTDLIETAPIARRTSGQPVFTYFNVDDVYTQGLETELRFRLDERFRGSFGYQFLDGRRKIERVRNLQDEQGELVQRTEISYERMLNRSRHSGNIRLFYQSERGWGANLRGTVRGGYGLFDRNGNGFADPDEIEPGYSVWSLAVTRKLGERISLQAGGDNLFNYVNINQPYLPGRLWYGQLSIDF